MTKAKMQIAATVNQKGGSGKSTVSFHWAFDLVDWRNQRVLFIEIDEQGNSSHSLRSYKSELLASQFFGSEPIKFSAGDRKLVLAGGDRTLQAFEKMVQPAEQQTLLSNLKARLADVADQFDWCIIDTPGSNSITAGAVLHVADYALIPTEIDEYNLNVTITMLKRIIALQKSGNPKLVNLGILANKFDTTKPAQKRDLEVFLQKFNQFVIRAKITNKSAYREASSEGVPVWRLKGTSARDAAKEIKTAFDLIAQKMGVE